MAALVAALCAEAGVAPLCETPPGLHVYQRVGPEGRVWFALNKTEGRLRFVLPGAWTDALSGEACAGALEVAPLDVRVLVEEG
jgi:beta-galactosidase